MDANDTGVAAPSGEDAASHVNVSRQRINRVLDVLAQAALENYDVRITEIDEHVSDEFLELEVAANMLLDELRLTREDRESKRLELLRQSEQMRLQQEEMVRALSTPVIVVAPGVLALPIIGTVETERAQRMTESLLERVVAERATHVILDLTGAGHIAPGTARSLLRMAQAMQMLGTRPLLTGISPDMARTLVSLEFSLMHLSTLPQLADALALVLSEKARGRGKGSGASSVAPLDDPVRK